MTREQLDCAARRTGVDADVIAASVERWMETAPLDAVAASARTGLVDTLDALAARGLMLAAVSDYPAERKLEALGDPGPLRRRRLGPGSAGRRVQAEPAGPAGRRSSRSASSRSKRCTSATAPTSTRAAAAAAQTCLRADRRIESPDGRHDETQRIDAARRDRGDVGATMTTTTTPTRASRRSMSLSGRPTLRGHLAIMRVDHWFKQVFVLPGIAIALSDTHGRHPRRALVGRLVVGFLSVCLVSSSNYVINEVLDAPSDLFHPIEAQPAGAVGSRQHPAGLRAVDRPDGRRRRARLRRQRAVRVHDARPVGDGLHLQHPADPLQGPALPRRAVGVDQQPAAHARRLVHDRHHRVRPDLAARELLDGRLLLHGDQALRRVQRDRRPGSRGDLPQVVRLLHARAPARLDHVLRLGGDAVPRRLRDALPPRADPRVPAHRPRDGAVPEPGVQARQRRHQPGEAVPRAEADGRRRRAARS